MKTGKNETYSVDVFVELSAGRKVRHAVKVADPSDVRQCDVISSVCDVISSHVTLSSNQSATNVIRSLRVYLG